MTAVFRIDDCSLDKNRSNFVSDSTCRKADFSHILKAMEVHFAPDVEKKLNDLAAQNGRADADELVQTVVEGYFDELAQMRDVLDSRYDDLIPAKGTDART